MNREYQKNSYIALYNVIDDYYKKDKNEHIANLASDMCPYTFKDSNSADPATYEDFLDCLNYCYSETEKMDITTAFKASIKFLEMYRDEFGFEIQKVIDDISLKEYETIFTEISKDES